MRPLPPPVPPEPVVSADAKRLVVTTFRIWDLAEAYVPERAAHVETRASKAIHQGRHELLRIPNPIGYKGYWLVLADELLKSGRKIGMAEGAWRQWTNSGLTEWGEYEIRFEVDDPPPENP